MACPEPGIHLQVGELVLDRASRRAWRAGVELRLSTKEFGVLEALMRDPGRVVSRYRLLESAWDYDRERRSGVVDAYVDLLRAKIQPARIEQVHGVGYRLLAG